MGFAMVLIPAGHALGAAFDGYVFELTMRNDRVWLISATLAAGAGLMIFLFRDGPEPAAQRAR